MHALPIALSRKRRAHLRTHSVNLPARLASFSWNDTLCPNLLADVPVVAFAVELGIGYNCSNGAACNHFIEQRSQGGAVIDGSLVSLLRQNQAPARIDGQKPFDPVTPRHGSTAILLPSTNEKRADGSRGQARRIHRYSALALVRRRPAALK